MLAKFKFKVSALLGLHRIWSLHILYEFLLSLYTFKYQESFMEKAWKAT